MTRRIRSISLSQRLTIKKSGIKFTVDSKSEYLFWILVKLGLWESGTYSIMKKFLDKQHSYIDIGAWIGPTVLYGCQLAKHCYAIEPDPIAFKELTNNVELNKNIRNHVTLENIAISDVSGDLKLYQPHGDWGQSTSSIISKQTESFKIIKSKTFQKFIDDRSINDVNFIKMDIEGAEFIVLPTIFDYLIEKKPTLLLEIHPMFVEGAIQKFEKLRNIFQIYDHLLNEKLQPMDFDKVLFLLQSKPTETIQILLTNKNMKV